MLCDKWLARVGSYYYVQVIVSLGLVWLLLVLKAAGQAPSRVLFNVDEMRSMATWENLKLQVFTRSLFLVDQSAECEGTRPARLATIKHVVKCKLCRTSNVKQHDDPSQLAPDSPRPLTGHWANLMEHSSLKSLVWFGCAGHVWLAAVHVMSSGGQSCLLMPGSLLGRCPKCCCPK